MPIPLTTATQGRGSGVPNLFLPGSGDALKHGGEAVMLYNNLRMHDQSVLDTYYVKTVDGLFSADIRQVSDPNPADHGATPHESFFGTKTITIDGQIWSGNVPKIRDMQQALRGAMSKLVDMPLLFLTGDPEDDFFITCRPGAAPRIPEEQPDYQYKRPFLITLTAFDGRIMSWIEHSDSTTISGTNVKQLSIVNRGDFEARPTITLFGPMTNPTVTNLGNGSRLALVGSIASGDSVRVEYSLGRKTMLHADGSKAWDLLSPLSTRSFEISRESTDIVELVCTAASGAAAMSINWRDTWW